MNNTKKNKDQESTIISVLSDMVIEYSSAEWLSWVINLQPIQLGFMVLNITYYS